MNQPDLKKVLFLCTGNSCRSQMAEGWGRTLLGDQYRFHSAGIQAHGLNPMAVKVMAEVGIDLTLQESQTLEQFSLAELDLVISVCSHADQNCPVIPSSLQKIHHPFDDPPTLAKGLDDAAQLAIYRRVRDEIKDFVQSINL